MQIQKVRQINMYEVISKDSGERIALCEQPRYVKINANSGAFIQCDREDAEGVAVNGEVYSLNNQLEGKPEAVIIETDTGAAILTAEQQAAEILKIKAAICELDLASGQEAE